MLTRRCQTEASRGKSVGSSDHAIETQSQQSTSFGKSVNVGDRRIPAQTGDGKTRHIAATHRGENKSSHSHNVTQRCRLPCL